MKYLKNKEGDKMIKEEFINLVAPLVQNANLMRNTPLFNSVVIAQAICETRLGKIKYYDESKSYIWN